MNNKRKNRRRIGLKIVLLGLLTVLYPLGFMTYNDILAKDRMSDYLDEIKSMDVSKKNEILQKAKEYNNRSFVSTDTLVDPFDVKSYSAINPLDYEEGEVFAYISIPKIEQDLPIYIGASQYHLSLGVGQLDGTDMPIGGKNTRSVLTGHRGGVDQLFFRHLDRMEKGDIITITAFDEVLKYEVTDMEVITPTDYEKLAVIPNEDMITLLTCTPYVTATHRLIVNAKRVEEKPIEVAKPQPQDVEVEQDLPVVDEKEVVSERVVLEKNIIKALIILIIISIIIVIIKLINTFRKPKNIS